ncbi:MAG: hypothetical protein ABWY00_15620 [Dongiaceae bacterium]
MAIGQETRPAGQAEIIAFEPALKRQRDREQFSRRYGEWVDPHHEGVDGLWVGLENAQIIPLVLPRRAAVER